jgi:DNA-binding CsgD family transcriptional regulator
MGRRSLLTQVAEPLRDERSQVSIKALIEQLTRQARLTQGHGSEPNGSPANNQSSVLLDVEVDGVRCVLTLLSPTPARDIVMLSPREQEIARMVMKGYPNKTIAKVLEISVWTVSTHLRRIFAKLGVGTRASMVARLLEAGYHGDSSSL